MSEPFQAVTAVHNEQGEVVGVRFHPSLKGKELEAAKAAFLDILAAVAEGEQN